ncbi:MFS transporter [Isoptericola sp. NPDC057391]|uniref:MFS transporter n=1 Tax=Isoptericola sp. NPDC057391 TaxID=3346117 RepID=UPI00362C749D
MSTNTTVTRPGRLRWAVIGLAAGASCLAIMDTAILGVAMPTISTDLGLDAAQTGILFSGFALSMAVFQLPAGVMVDKYGARRMLGFGALLWSLATAAAGMAKGLSTLIVSRILLGLGQAPQQQACVKVVSEWMPLRERALASGLYDTGGAVGSALAFPLAAALIALSGWRSAFVVCGGLGIIWALVWLQFYRKPQDHPRIGAAELAMLENDDARNRPDEPAVALAAFFTQRKVWGLILAFLTRGFSMAFFLTWLPTYLVDTYGFSLLKTGTLSALPIVAGVIGNLVGGFFTDWLVRRGHSLDYSRKVTMVLGIVSAMAMAPAAFVDNAILAVALLALANFGTQFASGAMWSLPADLAPNEASVGRLAGIQNGALWLGSFLSPLFVGFVVKAAGGNFTVPLLVGGLMGVLTLVAIFWIVGRIEPLRIGRPANLEEVGR